MTTTDSTPYAPATIYRAPDEPGRYGATLVCRRGGEKLKCLKRKETT